MDKDRKQFEMLNLKIATLMERHADYFSRTIAKLIAEQRDNKTSLNRFNYINERLDEIDKEQDVVYSLLERWASMTERHFNQRAIIRKVIDKN